MRKNITLPLVLILVAVIAFLSYRLGRQHASPVTASAVTNTSFIRQIAELSSLEVAGNTTFSQSNIKNDGGLLSAMKRMFLENTIHISVPFVAKYGVDLQGQEIHPQIKDSTVIIVLPQPKLLSLELRLDRADATTRKGWFESESQQEYIDTQKKMYLSARQQLAGNQVYIQDAKARTAKILASYFASMHYKAKVEFSDSTMAESSLEPQDLAQ